MKLTDPQRRVLWNVLNGQSPTHHCGGRSQYASMLRTVISLFKKGLLSENTLGGAFLTDEGRKILLDEAKVLG